MEEASKKKQFGPADIIVADQLRIVAKAFVDLQQHRHEADYSYDKKWSRTEVQAHVDTAADALANWKIVQNEKFARDYLVSLLVRERRD